MDQVKYYLWGAGGVGKRAVHYLKRFVDISGIIDNDVSKHGSQVSGVTVCGYEAVKPLLKEAMVIITHFSSKSTEKILQHDGFRFLQLHEFITHFFWEEHTQNAIGFLDFPITMRCTLNCRDCMQRVPLRQKDDVLLKELTDNLDALFQNVSFVGEMSVIGGEPFVYTKLEKLLTYIIEKYRDKIGSLVITTNGTITPSKETLELCHKNHIFISISDYGKTLPKVIPKLEALEKAANDADVNNERKKWSWSDPGKFDKEYGTQECSLVHMQLYDGKLWRCTLMAAAALAGLCHAAPEIDYYGLKSVSKSNIHKFLYAEKITTQCHMCQYPQEIGIESAVQAERTNHVK